jgi:hypothetical protein
VPQTKPASPEAGFLFFLSSVITYVVTDASLVLQWRSQAATRHERRKL